MDVLKQGKPYWKLIFCQFLAHSLMKLFLLSNQFKSNQFYLYSSKTQSRCLRGPRVKKLLMGEKKRIGGETCIHWWKCFFQVNFCQTFLITMSWKCQQWYQSSKFDSAWIRMDLAWKHIDVWHYCETLFIFLFYLTWRYEADILAALIDKEN